RVTIDAIYYALLNPQPQVSPFFDLTPLLELPRWVHALETLRETGSAKVVAKLLRGHPAAAPTGTDGKALAERMDRVSDAHGAGLPIELGREVGRFFAQKEKSFRKILRSDHRLPLSEGVGDQLHSLLEAYRLNGTGSNTSSKRMLLLDKDELKRQADLIGDLLDKANLPAALGLMNEWTVSWALWSRGETLDWLDFRRQRRKAAGFLGALEAVGRDASLKSSLSDQQQRLGQYWGRFGSLRNALHHHGMRPQVLLDVDFNGKVDQVRRYWAEELRALPAISLECGCRRYRHLLVSPIGERPGVLFSAIKRASREGRPPDFCLVICSPRSETAIPEALSRAGFDGEHCFLRLEDPYAGKDERRKLAEESRQYLASADDVSVNITGGTTLMGVVAEDLAQEARKLARPVRRFALIDRRSPEEQKRDPFVEGDILWLDNEERDGDY
ncbi:MAG: TM1812 family CRISPR-associated protein, partial [Candidatus Solibacter sp.]